MQGPFFNMKQAAEYCGYAERTFRDKVKEFQIPRCGDEENRFAASDLDRWMRCPKCFVEEERRFPRSARGSFTPVLV